MAMNWRASTRTHYGNQFRLVIPVTCLRRTCIYRDYVQLQEVRNGFLCIDVSTSHLRLKISQFVHLNEKPKQYSLNKIDVECRPANYIETWFLASSTQSLSRMTKISIFHHFYCIQFSYTYCVRDKKKEKRKFLCQRATGESRTWWHISTRILQSPHLHFIVYDLFSSVVFAGSTVARWKESTWAMASYDSAHVMWTPKIYWSCFHTSYCSCRTFEPREFCICILYCSGNEIFHFGTQFDGTALLCRIPLLLPITGSPLIYSELGARVTNASNNIWE